MFPNQGTERKDATSSKDTKKYCPRCGVPSEWWGMCDRCADLYEKREQEADLTARQEEHLSCGMVTESWHWFTFLGSNKNIEDENRHTWDQVRCWTPEQGNLYLWGPSGTGKTYAAACILSEALVNSKSISVTTGLHMAHHGDAYGSEGLVDAWRSVGILLIDDIDKGPWGPRNLSIMHYVFDGRATNHKPMIITSNLSPLGFIDMISECAPEWNQSYVDSIAGRMNPCTKLEFTGESLRGKMEG